jgi:uncharacterized SAM-binding protein YcdF (DUF218 family)
MVKLSQAQIDAITDYMFLPDQPLKAAATIVLGQTLWQRPLQRAIELYEADLSDTLIFTGGFNAKLGGVEATEMAHAWLQLRYPKAAILVDANASNTLQNMVNARNLITQAGLYHEGMSINLVSINYHMRRALETLQYVFAPNVLSIGFANYPSIYCPKDNWWQNEQGIRLILDEIDKMCRYLPGHKQTLARSLAPSLNWV